MPKPKTHYIIVTGRKHKIYKEIMKKTRKYAPALKNTFIPADYLIEQPKNPYKLKISPVIKGKISKSYRIDRNGIMTIHDGTITDFLYRKGATHAIAIETDTKMSQKTAQKINLLWIKEMISLLAKEKSLRWI